MCKNELCGGPSVTADINKNIKKIHHLVLENRRMTITEIEEVDVSYQMVHRILGEVLELTKNRKDGFLECYLRHTRRFVWYLQ